MNVSGWHNASNLRDDNGERIAYELLTNTYKQHEFSLLGQLLCANGLNLNYWREIAIPLIHEVVDKIRPGKLVHYTIHYTVSLHCTASSIN